MNTLTCISIVYVLELVPDKIKYQVHKTSDEARRGEARRARGFKFQKFQVESIIYTVILIWQIPKFKLIV